MHNNEIITALAARRKNLLVTTLVALVTLFAILPEYRSSFAETAPPEGRVIGKVELVPGMPIMKCKIFIESIPTKSDECYGEGNFDIRRVPAGLQTLRVEGLWLVKNVFPVGVNAGQITDAGTLIVSRYGAIHGQVTGFGPEHLARMLVTIKAVGIAKLDAYGYYLLDKVPPGDWLIELDVGDGQLPIQRKITVAPMTIMKKVDFAVAPRVNAPKTPDTQMALTDKVALVKVPDVSGQWKSNIGFIYNITQQQNNFQWTVTNGTESGNGTIKGNEVASSWKGPKGSASSQGKITTVDATGKATRIDWNNGVQFYR